MRNLEIKNNAFLSRKWRWSQSGVQGMGGWLECSQGSMTLEQAIQYCERKDDNAIALAIQ